MALLRTVLEFRESSHGWDPGLCELSTWGNLRRKRTVNSLKRLPHLSLFMAAGSARFVPTATSMGLQYAFLNQP